MPARVIRFIFACTCSIMAEAIDAWSDSGIELKNLALASVHL
jgi:hypothetical protein